MIDPRSTKAYKLEKENRELKREIELLKGENKRIFSKVNDDELLISNAMIYAEAQDYKSRCKKAIEYIEKYETIYGYFNDNNFNGEYIEDEIKNNILEILDKGE